MNGKAAGLDSAVLIPRGTAGVFVLQAGMKKKRPTPLPTEAEVAAPSIAGLTLDNLEYRVEALRRASAPTRNARAAINRKSRAAAVARAKKRNTAKKKK